MSNTLDDFFGDSSIESCSVCGATDDLVGIGWDAFNGRPQQHVCQKHYEEMQQEIVAQDAAHREQDRRLNAIEEDTTMEGE